MVSQRPTIFISHASTDKRIVEILKTHIDKVLEGKVDVYATSLPEVVQSGVDWLQDIRSKLNQAQVVIVLITPISLNRPWIWFEVGASWSKMDQGHGRICPVCVPEVELEDLPEPLSRLQARSLGKADQVKALFHDLCDVFGFGNMKGFKASSLITQLPRYPDVPINNNDLAVGTIYLGPYGNYTDEELMEVIDEWLNEEDRNWIHKSSDGRANIFLGKLIHFAEVDAELKLPPGASKRLLGVVAKRYHLVPAKETKNTIRYRLRR